MAEFNMTIRSGNAALHGSDGGAAEVARMLRLAADRIEAGHDYGRCMDDNGNGVGSWDFERTEPEQAECSDCGTEADPDDIGTTCDECGRGIIEAIW